MFVPEREVLGDDDPRWRRGRDGSKGKPATERRSSPASATAAPTDAGPDGSAAAATSLDPAVSSELSTAPIEAPSDDPDVDEEYDDEGVSGEGSDVHGVTVEELAPTAEELAELDALAPDEADEPVDAFDDEQLEEQAEDPNAAKRFWFEHATGAGKTVAAMASWMPAGSAASSSSPTAATSSSSSSTRSRRAATRIG